MILFYKTCSYAVLCFGLLVAITLDALAQTQPVERWTLQPGIYFPQAPAPHTWRKSAGIVFTTTPPELTEEVNVSVPAIDINIQRGLSKHWFITSRLQTQFVQSNVGIGIRWSTPLSERLFVSAGYDVTGWLGALDIKDVFDTKAYGIQTFPNASIGYKLTRDLRITARTEAIIDLYYRAEVGSLDVVYNRRAINGVAFAFVLEQPHYHQRNVYVGFRAAYSNFNWQLWSLFDTFNRNLLYPQLLFGFIL